MDTLTSRSKIRASAPGAAGLSSPRTPPDTSACGGNRTASPSVVFSVFNRPADEAIVIASVKGRIRLLLVDCALRVPAASISLASCQRNRHEPTRLPLDSSLVATSDRWSVEKSLLLPLGLPNLAVSKRPRPSRAASPARAYRVAVTGYAGTALTGCDSWD